MLTESIASKTGCARVGILSKVYLCVHGYETNAYALSQADEGRRKIAPSEATPIGATPIGYTSHGK